MLGTEFRGARLYLHVESARRAAFALDELAPRMARLERDGLARSWSLRIFPRATPPSSWLVLECLPRCGVDRERLRAALERSLRAPVERARGRVRRRLDKVDVEYQRRRYGGDRGLRIQELYGRAATPLRLELLALLRRGRVSQYEVALSSLAFYADTLRVPPDRLREGVERWLELLDPAGERDARGAQLARKARAELRGNEALRKLVHGLMTRGWRASSPELRALWSRHERRARAIGRLLEANREHFHPTRPRLLVVFHSYIHHHLVQLELGGGKELFVMLLVREFLRTRDAR